MTLVISLYIYIISSIKGMVHYIIRLLYRYYQILILFYIFIPKFFLDFFLIYILLETVIEIAIKVYVVVQFLRMHVI
jgi:hypothetical protein